MHERHYPRGSLRPGTTIRIKGGEGRFLPDGLVDGSLGWLLADQGEGFWTAEFTDSPHRYHEIHVDEFEVAR
jgi:hypothetical protein